MTKQYLRLNNINSYKIAFCLSNYIWKIVSSWNSLAKYSIGVQFIRAIDSISANIAEGFGRYNKKDKIKFFRYSFGSLMESLDWNEKAKIRNLLDQNEYTFIFNELKKLPKEINLLIKFTKNKLNE